MGLLNCIRRPTVKTCRAAIYVRVSTKDQNPEAQLGPLREYAQARGFDVVAEYIDHGVSGAKESRPALDETMAAASRDSTKATMTM